MKARTLFIGLFCFLLLGSSAWAEQSASLFNSDTITMKMLQIASDRAEKLATTYPEDVEDASFTVYGQKYEYALLSIDGYAQYFEDTHGPILKEIAGVDLGFCMDKTSVIFYIYTAFLVLMAGFYWFRQLDEVSKGKQQLEVTPFVLKLLVGLIVAYNLPFVYAVGMKIKDVGTLIVVNAMTWGDENNQVNYLVNADPDQALASGPRDRAIMDGLNDAAIKLLPSITDGSVLPSGRARYAYLVAALNAQIDQLDDNVYLAIPGQKTETSVRSGSGTTKVSKVTSYTKQGPLSDLLTPVGMTSTDTNGVRNPAYPSDWPDVLSDSSGAGLTNINTVFGYSKQDDDTGVYNKCLFTTDEYNNLLLGQKTHGWLTMAKRTNYSTVLCNWMVDDSSTEWAATKLNERLQDFVRLSANTYTDESNMKILMNYRADGKFYYLPSSSVSTETWSSDPDLDDLFPAEDKTAQAHTNDTLGDLLADIDLNYYTGVTSQGEYMQQIRAEVKDWVLGESLGVDSSYGLFDDDALDATNPKGPQSIWSALGEMLSWWMNLPRMGAEICLSLVKLFWIPMIAALADTIFNFIIEFYVYIIWLAYPFWFHKKTAAAFTGAINTMISACCTSAVFCLLALMFESFAGYLMRNVIGSSSVALLGAGGVAVAATGIGTSFIVGAYVAVSVGFSIFYIIGSFKCLKLAPKVFETFMKGGNIATPMMGAMATAVIGGVVGGALAGVGAGAGFGKSAIGKALGSKGGLVGRMTGASKLGSGISSKIGNLAQKAKDTKLGKAGAAVGGFVAARAAGFSGAAAKAGKAIKEGKAPSLGGALALSMQNAGKRMAQAVANPVKGFAGFAKSPAGMATALTVAGMMGQADEIAKAGAGYMAVSMLGDKKGNASGAAEGGAQGGSGGGSNDDAKELGHRDTKKKINEEIERYTQIKDMPVQQQALKLQSMGLGNGKTDAASMNQAMSAYTAETSSNINQIISTDQGYDSNSLAFRSQMRARARSAGFTVSDEPPMATDPVEPPGPEILGPNGQPVKYRKRSP